MRFGVLIKDKMKQYCSSFVILMDTHTSGKRTKSIVHKISLRGSFYLGCKWSFKGYLVPLGSSKLED